MTLAEACQVAADRSHVSLEDVERMVAELVEHFDLNEETVLRALEVADVMPKWEVMDG